MKIDRENRDDLLKQIGRTEEKIANKNREIAKIDQEIESWDRRKRHLLDMKEIKQYNISKHQHYINELKQNLNDL